MHEFSVWAPSAEQVALELTGASHRMVRVDHGWWQLAIPGADHGTDYRFRLDGGEAIPDPRSGWQPTGVHGPSRVFDTGRHSWSDDGWAGRAVHGSVLYELHIGTFTPAGTFDAAIERLPHLVELGVDMVSLLPVAGFPGRHGWGYDGVHLFAVHEPYGGPGALQRFVDACHRTGLGVCLDVVYNHLGPDGNYLKHYGPYFTPRHDTPWGPAVNLDDDGSHEVRRWICDNALRWLRDFHIDALRLDAVHALVDDSPTHLLAQLSTEVDHLAAELCRPLGLVAESDLNDPRMIEPIAEGGLGMTAQWSDDYHHALHALLTGERAGYYVDFGAPGTLAKTLTEVFLHDGRYSTFRGRRWGRPIDPQRHRGHAFLAYTSNHDQVGNRALGDRPSATLTTGQLAIAAALTLTGPFTPMLFMGEEWGTRTPWQYFTDHEDAELAVAVRDGRRREFAQYGWDADHVPDPQDPSTRDASVLDWSEVEHPEARRLLSWYRDLISLRSHPDLADDRLDFVLPDHDEDGRWFVVRRGQVTIVANLADEPTDLVVSTEPFSVVQSFGAVTADGGRLRLGPHATAICSTVRRGE